MALEPSGGVCFVVILIRGRILPFDLVSPVDGTDAVSLCPRDSAQEGLRDARKLPRTISLKRRDGPFLLKPPLLVKGSDF